MGMIVQAGVKYIKRDGTITGPLVAIEKISEFVFKDMEFFNKNGWGGHYTEKGKWDFWEESVHDLVASWDDASVNIEDYA